MAMSDEEVPPDGTEPARGAPFHTSQLFDAIKAALKARGLTYRDIAPALGLSESGVKKLFAAGDCTVSRLARLAELAGIGLADLVAASQEPAFQRVGLTDAQQRALLEDPTLLAVYWKLAIERWSLERVCAAFGLSERERRRCLTALDRLDLVRVEAGDRLRFPHGDLVRWTPEGPLLRHLHETWSRDVVQRCMEGPGLLRLHYLELSPEAARAFEAELVALLDRTLRASRAERLTAPKAVEPVSALVAVAPGSFVRPTRM